MPAGVWRGKRKGFQPDDVMIVPQKKLRSYANPRGVDRSFRNIYPRCNIHREDFASNEEKNGAIFHNYSGSQTVAGRLFSS